MSGGAVAIRVDETMTIYTALELKPRLLAAALASDAPELDLTGVQEIDSAGVQLLLLARREVAAAGGTLALASVSPAVQEALSVLGLEDWIRSSPTSPSMRDSEGVAK